MEARSTKRWERRVSLLLAGLAVWACSGAGTSSDGGRDGFSPIAFDSAGEAIRAIGAATCESAFRCAESYSGPWPFEVVFGSTVQQCKSEIVISEQEAAALNEDVEQGRTLFDDERASACHAWIATAECRLFWSPEKEERCSALLTGTLESGQDCSRDSQCASGECDLLDSFCR